MSTSTAANSGRLREHVLSEIRRIAATNAGKPPGKQSFATETGISEARWRGILWAKWSDALSDAGFAANEFQPRFDTYKILSDVIEACRHYGRIPSTSELQLYTRSRTGLANKSTIANHFRTKAALLAALRERASNDKSLSDIAEMLPVRSESVESNEQPSAKKIVTGLVYLIRSGEYYKIGRSEQLERRVKELTIAMPDKLTLVHSIKTDDPAGIEAYWHRRFVTRRVNGEWFKLQREDVSAFLRRSYQ